MLKIEVTRPVHAAIDAHKWTPAEIMDFYDSHLNLTLRELSSLTGRSLPYLKALLMHPQKVPA
jgi:hypothetical protein